VKTAESTCPIAEVSGSKWSSNCFAMCGAELFTKMPARGILPFRTRPTVAAPWGLAITEGTAGADVAWEIRQAWRE